jgi:hypothetical protein
MEREILSKTRRVLFMMRFFAAFFILIFALCGCAGTNAEVNEALPNEQAETSETESAIEAEAPPEMQEEVVLTAPPQAMTPGRFDNSEFQWLYISNPSVVISDSVFEYEFPVKLTKGSSISKNLPSIAPIDASGITDLATLLAIVQTSFEIDLDFYYIEDESSSYDFDAKTFRTMDQLNEIAANGGVNLFDFSNSFEGVPIIDPLNQQGIFVSYSADQGALTLERNNVNEFIPSEELVRPMPFAEAVKIAESQRSEPGEVLSARLSYTCAPEAFGDEDYHLCWRISAAPGPKYYVSCKTGELWSEGN